MRKITAILLIGLLNILLSAEKVFEDVPTDHWAAPAINNVVNLGITKGYSDGTFKGDGLVSRYDLMVFLNNLSISMEKMMDKKIEQVVVTNPNLIEIRVLEEMKLEIEKLKEQLAQGNTGKILSQDLTNWQIKGQFSSRCADYKINAINPNFSKNYSQNSTRIKVNAIKEINNSLLELDLDTAWQSWEDDIFTKWDKGAFAARFLTKKEFSQNTNIELFLATGPGSSLVKNNKLAFRYVDSIGCNLNLWTLQYRTALERRTSTVQRVKQQINYNFKNTGIFSNSTLYYTFDNYYHVVTTNLQNTRQTIAADIYLTKDYIVSPKVINQYNPLTREKANYHEIQLGFMELIKNSINVSLMFAEMDKGFFDPTSIFNEEVEGLNLAEYRIGEYFSDYQNTNLIPSADLKSESGIKLWGNFTKNLSGHLIYINGIGRGDPDNPLLKNVRYQYSLTNFGLTCALNSNFQISLTQDINILRQQDIKEDIINEKINKLYFTGRF